eukprot:295868_1
MASGGPLVEVVSRGAAAVDGPGTGGVRISDGRPKQVVTVVDLARASGHLSPGGRGPRGANIGGHEDILGLVDLGVDHLEAGVDLAGLTVLEMVVLIRHIRHLVLTSLLRALGVLEMVGAHTRLHSGNHVLLAVAQGLTPRGGVGAAELAKG